MSNRVRDALEHPENDVASKTNFILEKLSKILSLLLRRNIVIMLNNGRIILFKSRRKSTITVMRKLTERRDVRMKYVSEEHCSACIETPTKRYCFYGLCEFLVHFIAGIHFLLKRRGDISIENVSRTMTVLRIGKYKLLVPLVVNTESLYGTFGIDLYSKYANKGYFKNSIVVDIGAFIGDTVLYSIDKGAQHVIAIECDNLCSSVLKTNILINRLQDRVTILNTRATPELVCNLIENYIDSKVLLKINCMGCEYELLKEGSCIYKMPNKNIYIIAVIYPYILGNKKTKELLITLKRHNLLSDIFYYSSLWSKNIYFLVLGGKSAQSGG